MAFLGFAKQTVFGCLRSWKVRNTFFPQLWKPMIPGSLNYTRSAPIAFFFHIRLGKNRKSCAEKTWFLRRVQASRTGSDPPRQFFRSQIRVLKKTLHKLRFANRNPSGLDPFLDLLFGAKNQLFSLFLRKNTKKVPQYTHAGNDQNDRKLELRSTCPVGCYLVKSFPAWAG